MFGAYVRHKETLIFACLMTRNHCMPISDASNEHRSSFPWPYWRAWWINTLWTGDADLRLYITTVQDGWRKSAFL